MKYIILNILVIFFTLSVAYSQNKEWNLLVDTDLARYTGSQVFETDSFYLTFGKAIDTFNRMEQGFAFSKISKKTGYLMDHFFYKELGIGYELDNVRTSFFDGKYVVFPLKTRFENSTIQIIKFNIHTFSFEKIAIIPTPISNKYAFSLNDFIQIDSFYYVACSHAFDEEITSTLRSEHILIKINVYTGQYKYIHYNKKLERLICNRVLPHKQGIILFCRLVGNDAANGNLRLYHMSLDGTILWEYTFPSVVSYAFIKDVLPISEHEFLFSSYTSGGQSGARMAVGRINVETKETSWVTAWDEPFKLNIWSDTKIIPTQKPNEYLWMSNDFIKNDSIVYTAGRITRFTDTGERLWHKTYYYSDTTWGVFNDLSNIIKTQDENYLLVGFYGKIQTTWLLKINEDGDILPIDTTSSVTEWVETAEKLDVRVYPNPASDYLNVAIQATHVGQEYRVSIVSIEGQVLKSFVTSVPLFTMDMSDLNAGVYTLQIQGQNNKVIHKRFIKIQ